MSKPERYTVDLAEHPDLVVIYLGMRVEEPRGLRTLAVVRPEDPGVGEEAPDGLLLHEYLIYSLYPLHVGMRQYWRDFDSLEAGRMICRTRHGGRDYLRDRAAPSSGTRRTSAPGASSRCTWT